MLRKCVCVCVWKMSGGNEFKIAVGFHCFGDFDFHFILKMKNI